MKKHSYPRKLALALALATLPFLLPAAPVVAKDSPTYTLTSFSNGNAAAMNVYRADDALNFKPVKELAYQPPQGLIRDPSIMRHSDGNYYVVYTTNWTGDEIGFARSSDLTSWTFLGNQKIAVPGITNAWAPEWFRDDDGSVHVVLSVSSNGTQGLFKPWFVTAQDAGLTQWSAPKLLSGLGPNYIDAFIIKQDRRYYAFAKNETTKFIELATAASLEGPWVVIKSGDWAGWGRHVEGPALVKRPDGGWRLYFDQYMDKRYWYSDSINGFDSWSPKVELPGLSGTVRHFTVLKEGGAEKAVPKTAIASGPQRVTYDKYSLKVDGNRIFSWGGEMHPFRLPSPDLWRDVFQKMKASGYNTVAIYFDWGYHSPKQGVYDFTGIRDMDRMLTMAQEAGLYVVARPGPYMNAEVTRGGFPSWLVNQQAKARTDHPEYLAAADEWLTQINAIIAKHQINNGGSVILYQIENELDVTTPSHQRYMQHLYEKVRADGITVPIFHNDKGRNGYWVPKGSNVPGTVEGPNELYAFDGYPGGSCNVDGTTGTPTVAPDWGLYGPGGAKGGASASPNTPGFAAEFGGGWFDYWGSNDTYPCTAQRTGSAYQRVFYGSNIANGLTIQSFYMTFGGTSWGWLPAPVVFTSYDYGSAIDETRGLREKAQTMKLMGHFLNTVKDLTQMEKADGLQPSSDKIKLYHNVNSSTGTRLLVAMHNPPNAQTDDTFTFKAKLPDGEYAIPQAGTLRINGYDAKMWLAGYNLERQRLVYSTSELFTHLRQGAGDLALFYGRKGEDGETVLRYASAPTVTVLEGTVESSFDAAKGDLRLNYVHDGLVRVRISGGGRPDMVLLLADVPTAQSFSRQETAEGVLLQRGPSLVRSAKVDGRTLDLTGDTSADSALEVWAPVGVSRVRWNGEAVSMEPGVGGSLIAKAALKGPEAISLPDLTKADWRFQPGSPEAAKDFDDSGWQKVRSGRTASFVKPPPGQPLLNMDDYGFHHGDVWYRGRYTSDGSVTKLDLHYGAGGAGMVQVWLDGQYLGQNVLPTGLARPPGQGVASFTIPEALRGPGERVLSVMVRNNSHHWDLDADDLHKEARGLISASLTNPTAKSFLLPIAWKIQGNLGGEDIQDKVRGPMNNGGLYGERAGWYLPGFDDRAWQKVSVPAANTPAGTSWYRTEFTLDAPKGHDVSLGLSIGDTATVRSVGNYRALIFVNGWNMGQFIADVGPQRTFVIPTGILNPNGKNTLALAVTSDGKPGDALEAVRLVNMRTARSPLKVEMVKSPAFKEVMR